MLRQLGYLLRCLHLDRVTRLPPDYIARMQHRRLRRLVEHAIDHSPFFRRKYRAIDVDRLHLADLPPLTKGELMAHFDETVTDPAVRRADLEVFMEDDANRTRYFQNRYVVSHTSGSQGQPLLLVQERAVYDLLFALQMGRGNAATRVSVGEALRLLRDPLRLATVGSAPGFYPSSIAFAHLPAAARSWVRQERFAANDPHLVDRLNDYQPHVLIGYASVLDTLAVRGTGLRLGPTLRQIVNNSETLTPQARQRVAAAFGVPILDNYAAGECMFLTTGCRHGPGAHVNADWAILEVVDDAYRPVPAGTLGKKVLMTNLANFVQPIIRYEVGDVVALGDAPCPCGSRLPKVTQLEGRAAETLWVRRGDRHVALPALIFKNVLDYLHELREWQAVQEAPNRIDLRLELLPGSSINESALRHRLLARFRAFGMPDEVALSISLFPALAVDPITHKARRIIDRVGAPEAHAARPGASALVGH